ncbi:hypothetical protein GCZ15_20360 [Escherichia coli]|nr:hypothetical protein [Escherichia coli]MBM5558503.1 hypothetical protein [Klebsiella quasipneumoniae]MBZ6953371.1 hypothetical protein [Klebsiella grimontii]PXH34853.1 hypothetical protein DMQ64_27300 [Klebsiella pneumoniae]PXL86652.1 hypothetical protein DMT18_27175 [Klebsiella variicola]RRZ99167.1 hypothetical protein EGK20_23740 [Enterobacter hormaechei]
MRGRKLTYHFHLILQNFCTQIETHNWHNYI